MATSISTVGDDKAARYLTGMGRRALDQSSTMEREGHSAQRRISGIPVRTGRLERGVRGGPDAILSVRRDGYTIATRVPYARFVFGGTKKMRAQPPRIPSNLSTTAAASVGRDVTHSA